MLEIKKSIEQGFSGQPGGLYDILKQLQTLGAGIGGDVFFVDQYAGSNGGDGKSWEKAFKTIKHASTVSDAVITSGGGKGEWRNTIFCRGRFDENLTDFAQKTDYIGVGSLDARSRPRLTGHHTASSLTGTRFFNWEFMPDTADAMFIFTDVYGIEFHSCMFQNALTWNTVYALEFVGTSVQETVIADCIFKPDTSDDPFATAAIHFHCDYSFGLLIRDNLIEGEIGISIDTYTFSQGCWVINNVIKAVGKAVADVSDDIVYANNTLISTGQQSSAVYDWNVKLCGLNIITGTDETITLPDLQVRTS